MKNKKLSLIISSCDAFSDLWDAHYYFLNKNWANRNLGTFLVTDKKTDKCYDGMQIISTGDNDEMPTRLKKALTTITSPYVLLTLDDYFLIKPVEEKDIQEIVSLMEKNSIDYCRLYPINKESKRMFKRTKWLYKINLNKEYAVNLYPGIWKTDFLKKTIYSNVSAWEYEVSLTHSAINLKAVCTMSRRKDFYILDVVRKGKILHKANRYLKKHGIQIGNREIVSRKTEIRYFIFGTFSHILPNRIKKIVKKIMIKMGFKFYS